MKDKHYIKADIIDAVVKNIPIKRKDTKRVIDQFIIEMRNCLIEGNSLQIRGLGSFCIKTRKARTNVRNPRTGEKLNVGERRVVAFRSGKILKEGVRYTHENNRL